MGKFLTQFRSSTSGSEPSDFTIRYASSASLRPDATDPRPRDTKQIEQIERGIQSFGFNVPVMINSRLRRIACRDMVLDPFLASGTNAIAGPRTAPFVTPLSSNRVTPIGLRAAGKFMRRRAILDSSGHSFYDTKEQKIWTA